jgi:lipopolysaccharide export LptBFGC system permease protein LptF
VFTLWRHYAARFLSALLAALAILALLAVAVDAMLHIGSLAEETDSLAAALRLLLERSAAAYTEYLLPIAAFVAAFWCAGGAMLQRETLALKASGISPLAALAPLLLLALALCALQGVALETLGVRAAAAIAARKSPHAGDVRVREGGAWYHAGRVVYWAREVDAHGVAHDVRLYERDAAGQLVRTIAAARATRLRPQTWEFAQARVRELDPARRDAPPRDRRETRAVLELPSDRSPVLGRHELAALPLATLRRLVATLGTSGSAGDARILLHNRLSSPPAVFVLALLAIPLALRSEGRRSLARAALQGAALVVLYLMARDMGSSFAARSRDLAITFPWLTLGALELLALLLLARTPR